jgi:superfamily II DNA or RNA helicase
MEQACTPVNAAHSKTILTLSNRLILQNAPGPLLAEIERRLTFDNPAYLENKKMGRWNGNTPQFLKCYRQSSTGALILPRGFTGQAIALIRGYGFRYEIEDRRRVLPPVDFAFTGSLRPFQEEATWAMRGKAFGTLTAPTGSGKTVMALALIVERKQPVLIVVHTRELADQWLSRIESFLGIPREEIGVIGGGKKQIGEKITVAMVQTLVKIAGQVSPYIGHLIVDEVHHCPSRTFTEVVTAFDSRFMLGLSATPWRRDGLSRLIFWYVGDVVHEIKRPGLVDTGNVLPFEVVTRETRFQTSYDPTAEYSRMLAELTEDPERNSLIADSVAAFSRTPGIALVLTDRKEHCRTLRALLRRRGIHAEVLTGDCPALTTLFIATPIRFDGRLVQYLGRVVRPAPGKKQAQVIDFVDSRVGVLAAAARSRQQTYQGQVERAS